MKNAVFSLTMLLPLAAITGCATSPNSPQTLLGTSDLRAPDGSLLGTASVHQQGTGAILRIEVRDLTPGLHGVHIHAIGRCDDPAFASAGGHLNPAMRQHGSLNPAGSHLGDLPNIAVKADGTGRLEHMLEVSPEVALAAIYDADGSAVVVHASEDDYRTDPTGNSGGRVACGVIVRGR